MFLTSWLDTWNERQQLKREAHIQAMREQGKCPNCNGNGYYPSYLQFGTDCLSCKGTGTYEVWEQNNQLQ